jgi:hypothetical protein
MHIKLGAFNVICIICELVELQGLMVYGDDLSSQQMIVISFD